MPSERGTDAPAPPAAMPRWALIGGLIAGLLLFAILTVLTLTLVQLHDSGGHIEAQDKKIAALFQAGRPLAAQADELAGDVQPALREAGRFVAPLIQSDSGADLAAALERFPLLDSSVRRLAAEAVPVLDGFDPAVVTAALNTVVGLAAGLAQDDRLVRLVDGASAALVDISDRSLVARAARTATRVRKLLEVQRRTRTLQVRSLSVQRRSLDIQRRTLQRVRSLDRKTLGEAPPLPVP